VATSQKAEKLGGGGDPEGVEGDSGSEGAWGGEQVGVA
jgi:hypothetical protein